MYIYKRQNISRSIKFLLTFHGPVHCSTKRAPFARTPLRKVERLSVDDADFFHFDSNSCETAWASRETDELVASVNLYNLLLRQRRRKCQGRSKRWFEKQWKICTKCDGSFSFRSLFCVTERNLWRKIAEICKNEKLFIIM